MLSRKYKLPTSFFKSIQKKETPPSRTIPLRLCRVRCYTSHLPHSRFAVVVSNSAFKNIVSRNRFRRMVYDVIRMQRLYEIPGWDMTLLFSRDAGTINADGDAVTEDIRMLNTKLKHPVREVAF